MSRWPYALILTVALLAAWQSAELYRVVRSMQRASKSAHTLVQMLHVLELSDRDQSQTFEHQFDSLLSQLQDRPSLDIVIAEDGHSNIDSVRSAIQARIKIENEALESGWLRLRGRFWLSVLLWMSATLLALVGKTKRRVEVVQADAAPTIPLSVTHMAMTAQSPTETPSISVRGYTDRVLKTLSNLLILAGPNGSIQMINDAVCSTLGYSREELLGTHYEKLASSQHTQLPPGTRNLETSFLSKSGNLIPVLVSCSAIYSEGDQIEGLVIVAQDISERKDTERSLKESEQRLRNLMERLVTAQEDERRTVARDLHDGMLQLVIASEMQLAVVKKKIDPQGEHRGLVQGIEYLSEAVREGRRLIHNLRPPALDKFGLVQSVRQDAIKLSRELECKAEFDIDIDDVDLPASLETSAFRICQEAMNNIRKYADPKVIGITLKMLDKKLMVKIKDDGKGFDKGEPGFESGVGLHSMRERAEMHGGELKLESHPGKGTAVTAIIPLQ